MISIRNRRMIVPPEERNLGVGGDTNSAVRVFSIPRYTANEIDLSALSFFLDFLYETGATNETVFADKIVEADRILLTWQIVSTNIPYEGTTFLQIKGNDLAGAVVWRSFQDPFYVGDCIDATGAYTGDLSAYQALVTRCVIIEDAEVTREIAEELRKTAYANALVVTANANTKIVDVETRFQNLTTEQQQAAEIIDARTNAGGTAFTSLKDRLDKTDISVKLEYPSAPFPNQLFYKII